MGGIGFDGKFLKKIVESGGGGRGGASTPSPTMGNPGQGCQGKSGNLLEDQGKKILSMQICNFNVQKCVQLNCIWKSVVYMMLLFASSI